MIYAINLLLLKKSHTNFSVIQLTGIKENTLYLYPYIILGLINHISPLVDINLNSSIAQSILI